jgi:hypothetical protein
VATQLGSHAAKRILPAALHSMRIGPLLLFSALLMTPVLTGCGDSETVPTAIAPSAIPPSPPGAPVVGGVAGFVIDTAFRPIADATVEVIEGPEPGTSARSDSEGHFSLQGVTFRAMKAGYISATQGTRFSAPGGRPWVIFTLQPESPPTVDIASNYTLTVAADAACATNLPHEARIRNYAVTIASSESPYNAVDTNFSVRFHLATISDDWDMSLGVAGNFVGFGIYGGHNPFLVEWLTPDTHLAFSGTAPGVSVAAGASTISTSFDGIVDYCGSPSRAGRIDGDCAAPVDRCEAQNHRLTLTRR